MMLNRGTKQCRAQALSLLAWNLVLGLNLSHAVPRKGFKHALQYMVMKSAPDLHEVPLGSVQMGISQARQRSTRVEPDDNLVSSIKRHGLLSPDLLRPLQGGRYELISGQRRYRAHELLGMDTIKALIVQDGMDDYKAKMISLTENVVRKDMKDADIIDSIDYLLDKYDSIPAVAEELGMGQDTVRRYVKKRKLPESVKKAIENNEYSTQQALRALRALGGNESTVEPDLLHETAKEMKKHSVPAQKSYLEIARHNPGMTPSEISDRTTEISSRHVVSLHVTNEQNRRIQKYKNDQDIDDDEEAVSDLVDRGLDAADA